MSRITSSLPHVISAFLSVTDKNKLKPQQMLRFLHTTEELMYKKFTNAEIAVMGFMLIAALIYRIAEDYKLIKVPSVIVLIVWLLSMGYIFFNRSIKLLINAISNRNNFHITTAEITDIKEFQHSNGSYDYYIISYKYKNKPYTQEIHVSFSIHKWKKGDRIKIKVDRNSPENIIIIFSDLSAALLMSIIGLIFEAVPIAVYIKTHS